MFNNTLPGFSSAAEYQVSGLPWVTGSNVGTSVQRHDFPKVARAFIVRNTNSSGNLYLGYTANGVTGTNRFTIPPSASERFEIRTKSVFLLGEADFIDFSLCAELTLIQPQFAPQLTGSSSGDPSGTSWQGVG